jgi:hypothetical protein
MSEMRKATPEDAARLLVQGIEDGVKAGLKGRTAIEFGQVQVQNALGSAVLVLNSAPDASLDSGATLASSEPTKLPTYENPNLPSRQDLIALNRAMLGRFPSSPPGIRSYRF